MTQHLVPDQQKVEYNRCLEQAFQAAAEIDPKLSMFFHVLGDGDLVKKLVAIVSFIFSVLIYNVLTIVY